MVAAAPARSWAAARSRMVSGPIRGRSPLITITVRSAVANSGAAAFTASAVPRGSGWMASVMATRAARPPPSAPVPPTSATSAGSSRRPGPSTTTILAAPASRAALTDQPIIGRPHSGCSSFGTAERIRVPSLAARITTTGALTGVIVGESSRRLLLPRGGTLPFVGAEPFPHGVVGDAVLAADGDHGHRGDVSLKLLVRGPRDLARCRAGLAVAVGVPDPT